MDEVVDEEVMAEVVMEDEGVVVLVAFPNLPRPMQNTSERSQY